MFKVNNVIDYGLIFGTSAETSGGLLMSMSRQDAEAFCKEIEEIESYPAFIIGDVLVCLCDITLSMRRIVVMQITILTTTLTSSKTQRSLKYKSTQIRT